MNSLGFAPRLTAHDDFAAVTVVPSTEKRVVDRQRIGIHRAFSPCDAFHNLRRHAGGTPSRKPLELWKGQLAIRLGRWRVRENSRRAAGWRASRDREGESEYQTFT